jgi:hypothetical protein
MNLARGIRARAQRTKVLVPGKKKWLATAAGNAMASKVVNKFNDYGPPAQNPAHPAKSPT